MGRFLGSVVISAIPMLGMSLSALLAKVMTAGLRPEEYAGLLSSLIRPAIPVVSEVCQSRGLRALYLEDKQGQHCIMCWVQTQVEFEPSKRAAYHFDEKWAMHPCGIASRRRPAEDVSEAVSRAPHSMIKRSAQYRYDR